MANSRNARVEIYAGGELPVYVSDWLDQEAAQLLADRKREQIRDRGWAHEVRIVDNLSA
jgi:hypothetical protein